MKILLISHQLSITGAPFVLLWMSKFLKDNNYDVTVWSLCDGPLKEDFLKEGLDPVIIKDDKRSILKFYKKNNIHYDLIICNTVCAYKCVDVLQRFNTPVIWYIHETKFLDDFLPKNPDCVELLKSFYNIYTVSDWNVTVLKKYNSNVKVIRNGVKDEFKNYAPPAEHMRFGFIGSVIPVKGIDLLIDAFMNILKDYPSATLDIAGDYNRDFAENLKEKTKDISNIRWLGVVQKEEKEHFFDSIDVLCVPSLDEPAGLTLLEGVMMGKAVVTTDKTGANYACENDKNGYIVSAGSVDELTNAIGQLCVNHQNISSMQQKSREIYLKMATFKQYEENVLKMVEDNFNNLPIVKTKLKFEKRKFLQKEKGENGERTYYLWGVKIFSYHKKMKGDK